jgi:pimeloyl-ACP methyl ester carboxylesterase
MPISRPGPGPAFVERIQGQTLPVLVVAGEHDRCRQRPETCKTTWLQHYPNARLEVMANAGHYPMDETPVALATVIEKFLREAVAA